MTTVWELDPVASEVLQAANYLEARRHGTGVRFIDAYDAVRDTIRQLPQFYPLVEDDHPMHEVRNALLDPFDYRVIYLVRPA